MESIFSIDVETIVSPYGAKYTHEIELLTQIIDDCLVKDFIHDDQIKEMLISNLKKRININWIIQKYRCVIDDMAILEQFDENLYMDMRVLRAWAEARLAVAVQDGIKGLEDAQTKFGHNFKTEIRRWKAIDFKEFFDRCEDDDSNDNQQATAA